MKMKQEFWWNIYGPFDAGEDDLPHMGQVISHYSKLNGMNTSELARKLTELGWEIGERRMEQLLSDKNIGDPQQISRRRLLSKLLAVPPILFGLSALGDTSLGTSTTIQSSIDKAALLRYESTLSTYWDNFYSSSIQKHSSNIFQWCKHLESVAENGRNRSEILTLLCRFEQLAAVTARDRLDYPTAIFYHNESVSLAEELGNAELFAASLVRRARAYIQQKKYNSALADLKVALKHADRLRDNLRGYVYQMASATVTLLPKSQDSELYFHRYSEEAGRILHKGQLEHDGSFIRLSLAGYHQDRARSFIRIGDSEAALDAIILAEQTQKPDMTRWQAELNLIRAEAYMLTGDVEWSCQQIEESYKLVKATESVIQKKSIIALYKRLIEKQPNQKTVRQLGALLAAG